MFLFDDLHVLRAPGSRAQPGGAKGAMVHLSLSDQGSPQDGGPLSQEKGAPE